MPESAAEGAMAMSRRPDGRRGMRMALADGPHLFFSCLYLCGSTLV